jgi:tetratricopeptide (TPR) repeat protein
MKSSTIGPALAACVAGLTASCVAGPGARPVKLTAVQTPSEPTSKIDLYYSAAVRAIEARDYAQALDYLQTARAIAAEDVRVINAFGVVYDKLGRFDLSRRYYAQAKALDPTSKVVDNNLAYSERLQGLSHEPLAFASAAEAEAKLGQQSDLMPGSPVVVAPIAAAPIIMVETRPAIDTAPELFGVARRSQVAAAGAAVKPAAAEVGREAVAASPGAEAKPVQTAQAAPKPVQAAQAAPKPVQVAQAAPKPVQVAQAAPKPVPAKLVRVAQATPKPVPAKTTTKLAGAPIHLIDASGSPDAARRLSLRLTRLGWSVQTETASRTRLIEASSRIDYPARTPQIARALANTLPGAVRVHPCAGACPAIRLVVGKDAQTWSQPKKAVSRS